MTGRVSRTVGRLASRGPLDSWRRPDRNRRAVACRRALDLFRRQYHETRTWTGRLCDFAAGFVLATILAGGVVVGQGRRAAARRAAVGPPAAAWAARAGQAVAKAAAWAAEAGLRISRDWEEARAALAYVDTVKAASKATAWSVWAAAARERALEGQTQAAVAAAKAEQEAKSRKPIDFVRLARRAVETG